MAVKKTTSGVKSKAVRSNLEGREVGFGSLLIAFLIGLAVIPAYYLLQYNISTSPNGQIVMIPRVSRSEKDLTVTALNPSVLPSVSDEPANSSIQQKVADDCARNRWLIREATQRYILDQGQKVELPTIFDLIGQKYLKELPNCPTGGNYELTKSKDTIVRCSQHGISR